MPRRKLIAGNWKMNGLAADGMALARALAARIGPERPFEMVVCPPYTLIAAVAGIAAGSALQVGAQDCHAAEKGAFTGDVSAAMLRDAGARWVILGHSERRAGHGEADALIRDKAAAALKAGLKVILCVGETEAERATGRQSEVVGAQLDGSLPAGWTPDSLAIAYEPVWAIGTGTVATLDDIAAMHAFIRGRLGDKAGGTRILYGGSVKADNAAAILALSDVDGALVGGASLKADDFWTIASPA